MTQSSISRRGFVAVAGAALAAPAFAQQLPPLTASRPVSEEGSLAAWVDAFGRPAATVYVNRRGPFKFLVDTGATTTVVAQHRAAEMGIEAIGILKVNGTTGAVELPFATGAHIQSGSVFKENARVVLMEGGALAKWDGVLGADLFIGRKVTFDIAQKTVTLVRSASTGEATATSLIGLAAPFTLRNRVLAELSGLVGKVRTKLILDTGADSSIANLALSEALRAKHRTLTRLPDMTVFGITGEIMVGEGILLPSVQMARMTVTRSIAVAVDATIFQVLDLQHEPAMLVGVDLLSRLKRFSIDYGRRTFDATPMSTLMSRGDTALG